MLLGFSIRMVLLSIETPSGIPPLLREALLRVVELRPALLLVRGADDVRNPEFSAEEAPRREVASVFLPAL